MSLFALSPEVNDFYTAGGFWVGAVSLVLGLLAFRYTLVQLWEARAAAEASKTAADAAREAAEKPLAENKGAYERFVGGFATRRLSDLESAVAGKDWPRATLRARDLAELLASLPGSSNRTVLIDDLRKAAIKFEEKPSTGSELKFDRAKWKSVTLGIHRYLDALRAPFRDATHDSPTDNPAGQAPIDRANAPRQDQGEPS